VSTRLQTILAAALFVCLTVAMTWPQGARLGGSAPQHQDVYFDMWRLGWFAHALGTAPAHVFDGNVLYPERRAMTFSDAAVAEGLAAAPLLWAGVRPVLVHNLLLLGAIAASGLAMFVLARRLTGSPAAGVAAGIVFAFAPYRFEHIMHMELQWAMWIPLTFWALDRAIESGRVRDGVLTGAFAGLQLLSSIYYGVYLAVLLAVGAFLFLLTLRGVRQARAAGAMGAGALAALIIAGVYAAPYAATKARVGGRAPDEVNMFSARPSSYLVATPDNIVYGRAFERRGRLERRLFPGLAAVLLGMAGLLLRRPAPTVIVYLLLMVLAFEMSLGLGGYSYSFLYTHLSLFSGLRAAVRLGLFVLFFIAVLAAFGLAMLQQAVPRTLRPLSAAIVAAVLLLEYRVSPIRLVEYPNSPPPLYAWLARQPAGVVAELPMPSANALPGADPFYTYMSVFHWKPMVNGYSAYPPASYLDRLAVETTFPDARALDRLRRDGVKYVLVHPAFYHPADAERVVSALASHSDLVQLGRFDDGRSTALAYELR
jgi:hypothetical protein